MVEELAFPEIVAFSEFQARHKPKEYFLSIEDAMPIGLWPVNRKYRT